MRSAALDLDTFLLAMAAEHQSEFGAMRALEAKRGSCGVCALLRRSRSAG